MMYPALLLLHPVAQIAWDRFTVHGSTVLGLLALGALYEWRARALARTAASTAARRPGEHPPTPGQRAMFLNGLLLVFLSLNGPLHDLSDSFLFSAHMVQHLVLTLIVPPLLLAGTPGGMLRPLLGVRGVGAALRVATRPLVCFLAFNLVLAAWHLPPMYNTAMRYHEVHIVQHLMFMGSSVLMWWPLLSPLPELPRLAYPMQMLYSFLLTIPMSTVSIFITYADSVLYPAYASAARLWGLSPMEDQLIGGLIMWIPGGLFFLGVMSVVFFKWAARDTDTVADAQARWHPTA